MDLRIPEPGKATQIGMVTLVNLTEDHRHQLREYNEEVFKLAKSGEATEEAFTKLVAKQDACMMAYRDAMSRAVQLFDELLNQKR